ncbi:MAG TPA: nucleotidyltransferase family protein [Pyrinomonadaceae bacterium]|nr:nucleotidyltransferase family protein [Pyrinomonadaceae bacterium]
MLVRVVSWTAFLILFSRIVVWVEFGGCLKQERCAALVLAAGDSSRLGSPKQLVRFKGKTLIARSVNNVIAAGCAPVFTVLGAKHESIEAELIDLAPVVVINHDWKEGMGSSISAGINAYLQGGVSTAAVLITLCDQPMVSVEDLERLLQSFHDSEALVVASQYETNGRTVRGVPAIFSNYLYPELGQLHGAEGAKNVIARNLARARFVEMPSAAFDLDTPGIWSGFAKWTGRLWFLIWRFKLQGREIKDQ